MTSEPSAAENRAPPHAQAETHLFTVRIWKTDASDSAAYRGNVRDVASGAYRNFRDWADLTAFMRARLKERDMPRADHTDAERASPT